MNIKEMAEIAFKMTSSNDWEKDWESGGCYLFLESAEFVEALRGKGDPEEEAADVLFAFLSMLKYNNISINNVLAKFISKSKKFTKE